MVGSRVVVSAERRFDMAVVSGWEVTRERRDCWEGGRSSGFIFGDVVDEIVAGSGFDSRDFQDFCSASRRWISSSSSFSLAAFFIFRGFGFLGSVEDMSSVYTC